MLLACAAAGCSSRTASYSAAEQIEPPAVVARPAGSPADRQLDALVVRDTAGLEPDGPSARVEQLDALVGQAWQLLPDADALLSVRASDRMVYVDMVDSARPNLELSVMFDPDNPSQPYLSEPRYTDDEPFHARGVDFSAPAALIEAITTRFPGVRVTNVRLNRASSYDFGLVWNLSVDDARGSLATVFADLDGTVIAVDPV